MTDDLCSRDAYLTTCDATVTAVGDDGVALDRTSDGMQLTITDDGRGFDPELARRTGGLGLISIEERVALLKGHLAIDTAPGQGTRIRLRVPVSVGTDSPSAAGIG